MDILYLILGFFIILLLLSSINITNLVIEPIDNSDPNSYCKGFCDARETDINTKITNLANKINNIETNFNKLKQQVNSS